MIMKRSIFILLFISLTVTLFAQKEERKAVRAGNKAYKDQLYGTAEAEYDKAIKVNPSSKEASFNLANSYYKQQKWDDALAEYQHYLTLENEDPTKMSSAWSNVGNTYLKKKANEKEGQQPVMPGQMPGAQQKQGPDNLKLSMEAYKNALRLNPKDEETRYNLAVVQKMIKDKEEEGGGGGKDDQQQNKDQDKDKDKDQNKDQNQDQNKDQNKDQKPDQNKDQEQKENQMSQDNIQQILQAIEQDEKETQERVKQTKAQDRKKQNENNRRQNKDW